MKPSGLMFASYSENLCRCLRRRYFMSKEYITRSNGFSIPLSRLLRRPHIEVFRFTYAAASPHFENDFQLDRSAEREACDPVHVIGKEREEPPPCSGRRLLLPPPDCCRFDAR